MTRQEQDDKVIAEWTRMYRRVRSGGLDVVQSMKQATAIVESDYADAETTDEGGENVSGW